MKSVTLITDGACKGNPGPGGWAFILRYGEHEKVLAGGDPQTTNNRMELLAVINGLETLKEKVEVEVVTDSKYIIDAFQKGWVRKWLTNGWKSSTGDVKNRDLWEKLVALEKQHVVSWRWVKGHSGHPDNDRVDEMAQAAAVTAQVGKPA